MLRYYKQKKIKTSLIPEVFTGLPLLLSSELPLFFLVSYADNQNQKNILVSICHGFTIASALFSAPSLNKTNSLLAFLGAVATHQAIHSDIQALLLNGHSSFKTWQCIRRCKTCLCNSLLIPFSKSLINLLDTLYIFGAPHLSLCLF